MARAGVDELIRGVRIDRWEQEYAAHVADNSGRAWWMFRDQPEAPSSIRPRKVRPEDDQGLLDPDFDDG